MLRRERRRKALSILCALCLLFSMFAGEAAALAPDDEGTEEAAVVELAGGAEANGRETDGEAPVSAEIPKVPPAPEAPQSGAAEEPAAAAEPEGPEEPEAGLPAEESGAAAEESAPEEPEAGLPAGGTDEAAPPAAPDGPEPDLPPEAETAGPGAPEESPAADSAAYNAEPIWGKATRSGVTVTVTASAGIFPEGTSAVIRTATDEEKRIGFDIAFTDASGADVLPADEQGVSVLFTIGADSSLLFKDGSDTRLTVYRKNGDGTAEHLKSIVADGAPVSLEIRGFRPSEYGVIGEAVPPARNEDTPTPKVRKTRAAESSNLSDFLVDVVIDAPTDENGHYIINPSSSYEMTLKFSERENLQFADEETLTYVFPDGVVVGDLGPTAFTIEVKDQTGTASVSGTYQVVNGQLCVRFNQDDPNFERLKAAANASFDISIASSFNQSEGTIVFAPGIVKEFVFDDSADMNITKSVVYDMDSDTASYVLQVSSAGLNENVVIEDRLTGTALIFNRDVTIESNIHGVISASPDYTSVANGFRVTIPRMANGEILTLRYTAAVDNDKITGTGTVEQTNNTARVTSDQVPDGKEASADFHGDVTFHQVSKSRVREPVPLDDGTYEATWLVRVNEDHKLTVGGHEIRDWVGLTSQPFMQFSGEGLVVQVTFEDGGTETRAIPWSELTTTSNDKGIVGWSYTPPESDGKAAYQIVCKTVIDPTGALGNLSVTNYVNFNGKESSATQTVNVVTGDRLLIRKEAVGTTDTESEWKLTVTVPGTGLPDLRVVDPFPRLSYGGTVYYDGFVNGSLTVDGLLGSESYSLYIGSDGHAYTLTFYQDAGQTTAGVLPTADGQPREIVIRFKTTVNQDWLTLAAENGYQDYRLYAHFNHADARSLDYRTPDAEAYVVPIRPDFVKNFVERAEAEIDGVTYPVFRYTLGLYGPLEDGVTILDTFNTSYLRFYEEEGIQIFGGNSLSPTDSNGTVSVTETADGMEILVSRFPKRESGGFYPYYSIEYALIVRDAAALAALNEDAASSQDGIELENTAAWRGMESSSKVTYSYFPYVDKELTDRPSAENGYVAEFKLIINKYAEDLDPTSDVLAIRDILSDNLRFLPDSLTISPAADSIEVQHDPDTNTLTFLNVPDETTFEITYRARVLGQGNVSYSNTVQFGKYEKTVEETTVVESSGGGSASNPSITLVKRDADSLSTTLAGATFQLYYMQGGDRVPVVDRYGHDVTFTTGPDGTVLIEGNQQALGWALWAGRTYCLVEISAPTGYEPNQEPTYFVLSETPSSQIEYDITGDQFSVQNTLSRVSVPVVKEWIGPAAQSVTVNLLADGAIIDSAELTADSGWQHTFADLPMYDSADGHEIVYLVGEPDLPGYSSAILPQGDGSYTIVNTNTETIDIPVTKQWVGEPASSVTVRLTADNESIDTAELTAAGDWQHTFTDLPKYDSVDGHEIVYDVSEDPVAGYDTSRSGTAETGFTFTNTITGRVSIPVTKRWIGPAVKSVTVKLQADGTIIDSAELTAAGEWQHTFTDLPKFDSADGHEIVYRIREVRIPGYSVRITGSMSGGFVITNTNTETLHIPVEKQWVGTPAESVRITLYADGAKEADVVLRKANNWRHTFTDLPKYDSTDGHRIVYSIGEDALSGYTTSIEGDEYSGFVVTNTKNTTPPSGTPKTGDGSRLPFYFLTLLVSEAGMVWTFLLGKILSGKKRSRKRGS